MLLVSISSIEYVSAAESDETATEPIEPCYVKMDGDYCGLFSNPFDAISNAFLKEYIGDWYLILLFVPFPICVVIITKNFTYGGFIGLIMVGMLHTIDDVAFEIALTMVAISTGLVFIETIYKRVFD